MILLDQVIKYLILEKVPSTGLFLFDSSIFKFKLEILLNPNIAFGIPVPPFIITLLLAIIISSLVYYLIKFIQANQPTVVICLTLIISGAVSNVIDRIRFSSVIDYLSLTLYNFNWPSFNLADALIVVTAVCLIIKLIKTKQI